MNNLLKAVLCSAAVLLSATAQVSQAQETTAFTPVEPAAVKSPNGNPFGLVYRGAISRNEPGKVNIHPIVYDLMAFDASEGMYLINQPLLMMAGRAADTFYMTEQCFSKAIGTHDKELFLIPGATHIQTYWVPEYVDQAVKKLGEFFGKHL